MRMGQLPLVKKILPQFHLISLGRLLTQSAEWIAMIVLQEVGGPGFPGLELELTNSRDYLASKVISTHNQEPAGQGTVPAFRSTVSTLWLTGGCLGATDHISEIWKCA